MPIEVIIGEEIICVDNSPERLIKTSIYRGARRTVIFAGGIGKFQDLLFKDQVLIARTDEGWFFSKDTGISWENEETWKRENPEFFKEKDDDYIFMKSAIRHLVNQQPALVNNNDPSLLDWLQEEVYSRVEILEIKDHNEDALLRSAVLKTLSENKFERLLYIFGNESKEFIAESIYKLHADGQLLRKRRLLDKVINESIFLQGYDMTNLYNFARTLMRFKMNFDINTVLISDLYKFFEKDRSSDFIESTFKLLCEICYQLNVRVIVIINLVRMDELEGSILPKTFRDPFCERFELVIQDQNRPVKIKPKDGY
jgi:hypothetical protein